MEKIQSGPEILSVRRALAAEDDRGAPTVVKVKGEFPWHYHEREDEFFMVWKGIFRVEFKDRVITLKAGECVVVPHGVEHRTCADVEAWILCFEPAETLNTGNMRDATFTAPQGVTI